ncbi:hypothetical protein Tco_1434836 [Tanacetum coccineum]
MMVQQVLNLIQEMMSVKVDEHQVLGKNVVESWVHHIIAVMQEVRLVAEMQKVKLVDDTESDWSKMERSCMC